MLCSKIPLHKSERQGLLLTLCQLPVSLFPAAADPVSMAPGSLERGTWCNEHMLHERLDIIEEVRGIVLAPEPYQTSALSF